MTFEEVIAHINQTKNPEESFIGIFLRDEGKYFGSYTIHGPDLDDPDYISISFEGGELFADWGEEEYYSLDEVPDEALGLHYKNASKLPSIMGYNSEHALHLLFPSLSDDPFTQKEKADFVKSAKELVANSWA
jgi:hypothetical protein